MEKTIYFDMDGTISDLYARKDWLERLRNYDATPYATARPLCNMSQLARLLHKAQKAGYKIGIISWLSKVSTPAYDEAVTAAKREWLTSHLPSVRFDQITIVSYGIPKSTFARSENDILFDDELNNRLEWKGNAYSPERIVEILRSLAI